jgi:DNA-binding LytR/AlgR family response regulator
MHSAKAQIALVTTQAEQNRADATKKMVEAQYIPKEVQAKVIASTTNNLPNQAEQASAEFDKRVKIAELMLKESDIKNKAKIVELQMADKQNASMKIKHDFLTKLNTGLKDNG